MQLGCQNMIVIKSHLFSDGTSDKTVRIHWNNTAKRKRKMVKRGMLEDTVSKTVC